MEDAINKCVFATGYTETITGREIVQPSGHIISQRDLLKPPRRPEECARLLLRAGRIAARTAHPGGRQEPERHDGGDRGCRPFNCPGMGYEGPRAGAPAASRRGRAG